MFKFIDLINFNNVCFFQKLGSFISFTFKISSDTLYIRTLAYFVYLDVSLYFCYYVLLCVLFLSSAICVCKYCTIVTKVYDLLVFIFTKQHDIIKSTKKLACQPELWSKRRCRPYIWYKWQNITNPTA